MLSKTIKEKCVNALIISSLCFFAGVTLLLIILLIQNGMIVLHTEDIHSLDVVLSIVILGGWVAFIFIVMFKVITIYAKVKDDDDNTYPL